MFGFDEHDVQIFEQTDDFVKQIKLKKVHPHMMIPFPGTKSYQKLEQSGRILTKDWSLYDGSHVVHQPKLLSPKNLEDGVYWFWEKHSNFKEKLKYWLG